MEERQKKLYAEVIVDISNVEVDRIFDYCFYDDKYCLGQRVIVPFGNRKIEGYIIAIKEDSEFQQDKDRKSVV